MNFHELPPVKEQLRKCVRCGRCRTVCPVFAEIKNETAAPRGHVFMVQMLRDGVVEPDMKVYDKLSNCLLCETCSTFCPSGIDIHELNEAARSYIYAHHTNPVKDLVFDKVWTTPQLMRTGSSLLSLADKIGLRKVLRSLGFTRLLPQDLAEAEKIAQDLPLRSARSMLPTLMSPRGKPKMKVAYFLGCGTDLFQPEVAKAAVNVLLAFGCQVVIPKEIRCCGLPHAANGKLDTARKLAAHNVKILNELDVDYIITDCASCSSALSAKRLKSLLNDELAEHEIEKFASRFYDLNVFMVDVLDLGELKKKPVEINVTYHDPCHLAKAQGIREAPRQVISSVPGLILTEMPEADRCCGGSGTFAFTHYDLSMKILKRKMDNIAQTGASVVATCCPSCSMQLGYGLRTYPYQAQVKHPVELVWESLSKTPARSGK